MQNKNPLLSKTLWLNLLGAVFGLFWPPANDWISTHADFVLIAVTTINFVLRLITKDKLSLDA